LSETVAEAWDYWHPEVFFKAGVNYPTVGNKYSFYGRVVEYLGRNDIRGTFSIKFLDEPNTGALYLDAKGEEIGLFYSKMARLKELGRRKNRVRH